MCACREQASRDVRLGVRAPFACSGLDANAELDFKRLRFTMLAYAPHRQEPVILVTERPVDLIMLIVILMMMMIICLWHVTSKTTRSHVTLARV